MGDVLGRYLGKFNKGSAVEWYMLSMLISSCTYKAHKSGPTGDT
jgi:hypothetical protein